MEQDGREQDGRETIPANEGAAADAAPVQDIFLTKIAVKHVRHLHDTSILLSETHRKHLILTGDNGSGKTSLLEALYAYLDNDRSQARCFDSFRGWNGFGTEYGPPYNMDAKALWNTEDWKEASETTPPFICYISDSRKIGDLSGPDKDGSEGPSESGREEDIVWLLDQWLKRLNNLRSAEERAAESLDKMSSVKSFKTEEGADSQGRPFLDTMRDWLAENHNGSVSLKIIDRILSFIPDDGAGPGAGDMITNEDMRRFLYAIREKREKEGGLNAKILEYLYRFQKILQDLYGDSSLHWEIDLTKVNRFNIVMDGREPFDLTTMSRGYSAIVEAINEILQHMTEQEYITGGPGYVGDVTWHLDSQGVVLIDEIDAHLHVAMQKKILPALIELFPNLQFIVTTHSPFVLSSVENAVVYDLEHRTLVEDGDLSSVPYSGIVEGYFRVDEISDKLEKDLKDYRALAEKETWTGADYVEAERLETVLESVPDFLAAGWKAEYRRLKLEIAADKGE